MINHGCWWMSDISDKPKRGCHNIGGPQNHPKVFISDREANRFGVSHVQEPPNVSKCSVFLSSGFDMADTTKITG